MKAPTRRAVHKINRKTRAETSVHVIKTRRLSNKNTSSDDAQLEFARYNHIHLEPKHEILYCFLPKTDVCLRTFLFRSDRR